MKSNHSFLKYSVIFSAILSNSAALAGTQEGDILVRLRVLDVNAQNDSSNVMLNGVPAFVGTQVAARDSVTLDIDFTYMVSDNFGVELLLDTSHEHDVALGATDVASVRVLPPSLIAQYHAAPGAAVRPYVGVGVNYTLFFDETSTAALDGVMGGKTDVDLDASTGLVFQAGVDFDINDTWFANIDFKKIDINTQATLTGGGNVATVNVSIDPIIVGIGIGMKF